MTQSAEKSIVVAIFVAAISMSQTLQAQVSSELYTASIRKLVTNSESGLCAAWVNPGPQDEGLANCNNRWVNFDCTGDFGSKQAGSTSFGMVQLAFVTGRSITINVTDGSRLDVGSTQYCLANQVQLSP